MSLIDIEFDRFSLSSSPVLNINYFPTKFYRLFESKDINNPIIINGSFLLMP